MDVEFPEYEDIKSSSEEVANEQSAQMLADSIEAGDPLITPPADPVATANLISMVDPEKVTPEDVETIAESTGSNPVFVEKVISLVAKSMEEAEETTQEAALENYSNRVHRLCNKVNFSDLAPVEGVTEEEKLMQAADIIPVFSDDVLNNVPSEEIATTMSEAMGGETESIEAIVSIAKNHMNDHINLNNDAVSDDAADDAVEEIGEESDEVIGTELEDNDPYATPMSDDELDSKIDTAVTNSDEFAKQNFSYDVTDIVKEVSDAWASTKKDIARAAHQGAKSAIKALTRNPVYEGMASWNKTTLQPALVQMKKVGINNPGIIVATAVSPLAIAALASTISDVVSYKAAADEEESLNNEANAESLDNAAMSAGAKASISLANNARMNASRHFSSSFAGDLYTKEAKLVQLDQYKDELANCLLDLGAVFNNEQSFWPKLSNFISQYRYQVGGVLAAILTALLPKFVSVNGTKLIIGVKNASFFERLSNIFNRDPAWIKELSKLDRYVRANPKMMSASFLMALGTAVAAWAQSVSPDKFKQFAPDIVEKLARVKFLETQIAQLESELGGAVASDLAAVTQPMEVIAKNFSLTEDTTTALELELNTPGKLTDSDTDVEPDTTAIGDPMLGIEIEDQEVSSADPMDNLSDLVNEQSGYTSNVQPAPTTTSPADNNEASYIGSDIIAAGQQGAVTGGDEPVLESAAELSLSERDIKDNDFQLEDEIIADNINLTPEMVEAASTQEFSNSIRRDRMRQSRYFSRWNFADEPASTASAKSQENVGSTEVIVKDAQGNIVKQMLVPSGQPLELRCQAAAEKPASKEEIKAAVAEKVNDGTLGGNITTVVPEVKTLEKDESVQQLAKATEFINKVWDSSEIRAYVLMLLAIIEDDKKGVLAPISCDKFMSLHEKILKDTFGIWLGQVYAPISKIQHSVFEAGKWNADEACSLFLAAWTDGWLAAIDKATVAKITNVGMVNKDAAIAAYQQIYELVRIIATVPYRNVLKEMDELLKGLTEKFRTWVDDAQRSGAAIDQDSLAAILCSLTAKAIDNSNTALAENILKGDLYRKLCVPENFQKIELTGADGAALVDKIKTIASTNLVDPTMKEQPFNKELIAMANNIYSKLLSVTRSESARTGKELTTQDLATAERMYKTLQEIATMSQNQTNQLSLDLKALEAVIGSSVTLKPQQCVDLSQHLTIALSAEEDSKELRAAEEAIKALVGGAGTFIGEVLVAANEGLADIRNKMLKSREANARGRAAFEDIRALATGVGLKAAQKLSQAGFNESSSFITGALSEMNVSDPVLKQAIDELEIIMNQNEIQNVIDFLRVCANKAIKTKEEAGQAYPALKQMFDDHYDSLSKVSDEIMNELLTIANDRLEGNKAEKVFMEHNFSRLRYADKLNNLRQIKIAMRRYYSAMPAAEDVMISDTVAYDNLPEEEEDFCGTSFCKTKKGQFCGTKSFSKKRKAVNPFGRYYFADESEEEEEEAPAEANADDAASEDESYDEPMDGDAGFEAENDEDFGEDAGWDEPAADDAASDELPEEMDDYDMSADEVDAEPASADDVDDATSDYITAPAVVAPTGEDMSIGHWEDSVVDSSLDDESMRQSPFADQYDSKPGENTLSATNAGEAMALQNDMMTLRGIDQFKGESNFSRTRKAALRKSNENSTVSGLRALLGDKYIK